MRHQQTSRNPGRTDTDLELERRGKMSDLTDQERAAFVLVAERLGCRVAAQHIRDDQRRRERVRAAPAPAPRPGPKPKPTPARGPMLMVVPQSPALPTDHRESFCLRVAALADEAVGSPWASDLERAAWAETARELRQTAGDPRPRPA